MTAFRKIKFAVPFAVLTVLVVMLWHELSSDRAQAHASMVGERVPSFSLPALYGSGRLSSKQLQGRVTILNFWASWCGACKAEHKTLMYIKRNYNVPIYGVAYKDDPRDAKKMLSRSGNPYTNVAYDEYGDIGIDFGIYATPETYVISPSGKIVYKQIGAMTKSTWKNTIYPIVQKYSR